MSDLLDEVTAAFHASSEDQDKIATGVGGMHLVSDDDDDMVGFSGMRETYEKLLMATLRRGYRYFAGTTMPEESDALVEKTSPVLGPDLTWLAIRAFADGVMIGQQDNPLVKMALFYDTLDELFDDKDYKEAVDLLANGFKADEDVLDHFNHYLFNAVVAITHATGFAHGSGPPSKIWDVWALAGAATQAASYLAGMRMGDAWKLRDELDGIAIATEEGSDGSS